LCMALAELEPAPFWYVVEDAVVTVTCCPAAVVSVKPELDTLAIVPDAPPAAGPERALDPPPRAMGRPALVEVDAAAVGVAEPLLAVALTMPYAPPPITTAAARLARSLVGLWKNIEAFLSVSNGGERRVTPHFVVCIHSRARF
jgi:hypothetical protein